MVILWKARQKDPVAGYATTFLVQLEQVLGSCLDRGIKVVANAGGLNPAGLADAVAELAAGLGLQPKVAYIERRRPPRQARRPAGRRASTCAHLDTGRAARGRRRSAGHGQRLPGRLGHRRGARGRRRHRGLPAGHRRLTGRRPGRLVARLGAETTGTGWPARSWPATSSSAARRRRAATTPSSRRSPTGATRASRSPRWPPTGVRSSPSSNGTGGLVSPGTVTAQLLYEIDEPAYLDPDVVARFDTVRLDPGRARPGGRSPACGATPPPPDPQGGLQLPRRLPQHDDARAHRPGHRGKGRAGRPTQLFSLLGGRDRFDDADVRLLRFDRPDAAANEQATAHLRITVKDRDLDQVGRSFSHATMATRPRRLRRILHHDAAHGRQRVRGVLACAGAS